MFPSDFDILRPPSRTGPACSQKVTNGRVSVAVSDCAISFSWCG